MLMTIYCNTKSEILRIIKGEVHTLLARYFQSVQELRNILTFRYMSDANILTKKKKKKKKNIEI